MDLIEEIKNRINIVDLANQLGLRVNGSNFILSIYKNESNPSLKLYPKTNSYYCFATGQGGDVIKFFADVKGITMKEAVKELREGLNLKERFFKKKNNIKRKAVVKKVEITKYEKLLFEERAGIIEYESGLNKATAELKAWEEIMNKRMETQNLIYESLEKYCFGIDEEAFDYLSGNERGLKPDIIKMFRLFSIKSSEDTINYLRECFSREDLIVAGLLNNKGSFIFSNHRLIIPYMEENKIVYLRGRCLENRHRAESNEHSGKEPKGISKYTGLYNFAGNLTSKRFYNKDTIAKTGRDKPLIICEGEFDTMIMEQAGFNAVGVPGVSNFPEHQIELIRSYEIYLAYDNDDAGEEGMIKAAEFIGKPVKVIKLKNHKDLTEYFNAKTR